MISSEDIDLVKEQSVLDVASSFGLQFQKRKNSFWCCCPFHNEDSPSFHINTSGNYYHCFGCGAHGNAVDFVINYRKVDFINGVKEVAKICHVELEEENREESKESIAKRALRQEIIEANKIALKWFQGELAKDEIAFKYLQGRWSKETISRWCLGFAPDSWDALLKELKKAKVREEVILKAGLAARSEKGRVYSWWRNRVMFPIFNERNEPIAFSGRTLDPNEKAKYINTCETPVYRKSETIFGLNFARKYINDSHEVVIVEGNGDVLRLSELRAGNVVACCGTALPEGAIKKLGGKSNSFVLMYDGDEAGARATEENGEKIMLAGYSCRVICLPYENGKQDPDSFFTSEYVYEQWHDNKAENYVLFLADKYKYTKENPEQCNAVMRRIAKLLVGKQPFEITNYINSLSRILPTKSVWQQVLGEVNKEEEKKAKINELGLTEEQDEMVKEYGFYQRSNEYHIMRGENSHKSVSNFVLTPLFHIESSVNSKRLFRMANNRGVIKEIEIPQKDLGSRSAFKNRVASRGNFMFSGNDSDLDTILRYLYDNTKTCKEVIQLGWQKEGFWAWANGIVTSEGNVLPVNELGMVQYANEWYYIAACSSTTRQDEDFYMAERRFVYRESDADMYEWAKKMVNVYGEKGMIGIAYAFTCFFRDIIFERHRSFPILNIFGQKGSGKTKFIMSLLRLLGDAVEGPDVSTSTLAAIGDHLGMMRNGFVHLDEYKNDIDSKVIALLKGAYDGRGRTKKDIDHDMKLTTTKVDCGLILSGQEMTTADNALFSRVLYITFETSKFTEEETERFEDLKAYEHRSLTNISNRLIALHDKVKESYGASYSVVKEEVRAMMGDTKADSRIIECWSYVLAVMKSLKGEVALPFTYETLLPIFVRYVERQDAAVSDANEVSNFWRGVETLYMTGEALEGFDIRIDYARSNLKLQRGDGKHKYDWESRRPYNVLYLNPARIFVAYARMNKQSKSSDTNIVPEETLKYYLKTQEEYLGTTTTSFKFIDKNTERRKTTRNVMVFDYDKLRETYGVDFEVEKSIEISEEEIDF